MNPNDDVGLSMNRLLDGVIKLGYQNLDIWQAPRGSDLVCRFWDCLLRWRRAAWR